MNGHQLFEDGSCEDGFTLIEAIVVLIIAVMMLGVGATAYNNYIDNIKAKQAANEMKRLGYAFKTMLSSNRLDIINGCAHGGDVAISHDEIRLSQEDDSGKCYLSLDNIQSLNDFMISGSLTPIASPYRQPYYARGEVKITKDVAKSVITPLLIAGDIQTTRPKVQLDALTAAKIVQFADANMGYTASRGASLTAEGNTLFDMKTISAIAQGHLSTGYIFYIGEIGEGGVESELGYITQAEGDNRYLVRNNIDEHPEYNQMNTDLLMKDKQIITQGGVTLQPTSDINEGDSCDIENNIKRDRNGYLVQCVKVNKRITMPFTTKPSFTRDGQFNIWRQDDVLNEQQPILIMNPGLVWQYIFPDDTPDNIEFVMPIQNSAWGEDDYFVKGLDSRSGIIIPMWYPYGKMKVCFQLIRKENTRLFTYHELYMLHSDSLNNTLKASLRHSTTGHSDIINSNRSLCEEMAPGEYRLITGFVGGVTVHYKGSVPPRVLSTFKTNGICGGVSTSSPIPDPS